MVKLMDLVSLMVNVMVNIMKDHQFDEFYGEVDGFGEASSRIQGIIKPLSRLSFESVHPLLGGCC